VDRDEVTPTPGLGLSIGLHEDMAAVGPYQTSQAIQPMMDYRSWPRLDVTMATHIQPSSFAQLGK